MTNSVNSNKILELRQRTSKLSDVSARKMFGYDCYCIKGKFFVGFSRKNKFHVIIRLQKNEQQQAIKNTEIKPFSHGAKVGWIEVDLESDSVNDSTSISVGDLYEWIKKSYIHALRLANQK